MTTQFSLFEADPNRAGAQLSRDGVYRYDLWRRWSADPPLTFVMLNPSTADAQVDDATVRRCIGFARRDGFGGIAIRNLFAFRATDPTALVGAADPVGPENDAWLSGLARCRGTVVAAWGANGRLLNRADRARHLLPAVMWCLGRNQDGSPRHPLYVPAAQPLEPWR